MSAVAFLRWDRSTGASSAETAHLLRMRSSTLTAWRRLWFSDRLRPQPRGPRIEPIDAAERELLKAIFYLAGPGISVATLRDIFPDRPRAELEWPRLKCAG